MTEHVSKNCTWSLTNQRECRWHLKIFYNISLADNISIGLIAGGLYEKMVTSAAGLLVGIVAFVAHHILISMIDHNTAKMETSAIEFIDILQEPAK